MDLRRARLFLARHGYPGAEIRPRIHPRPRERQVEIVLDVEPGALVHVGRVTLEGIPDHLEPRAREVAEVRPGSSFRDEQIRRQARRLSALLKEAAHALAEMDVAMGPQDSARVP